MFLGIGQRPDAIFSLLGKNGWKRSLKDGPDGEKRAFPPPAELKDGGAEGIRTHDPHNAIVVLYQLSYDPIRKRAQM